jgi:hypothetical protein
VCGGLNTDPYDMVDRLDPQVKAVSRGGDREVSIVAITANDVTIRAAIARLISLDDPFARIDDAVCRKDAVSRRAVSPNGV